MLDSDIGNSILPMVRFYQREVKHNFNSDKENRPVYNMVDFVRIEIPGRSDSIIDTFANEGHKKAYPQQWARYVNEKRELGDDEVSGTMLKDWSVLTPAQAKELRHYHFYTVEQVSQASDAQLAPIVMIIGMGAHSFRDKAKAFLASARGASEIQARENELKKRDAEIEALKAQMQELMSAVSAPNPERKKPGRKPKAQEAQA